MKEQMLKRKLNPFLLITTVLVLAILAGSSVFYQTELSDLVSTRNQLQEDLENTSKVLQKTIKDEKELNSTVDNLEESMREKNTEIELKDERITVLERELDKAETENTRFEQEISTLNSTVSNLNDSMETLNGSLYIICNSNSSFSESAEQNCEDRGY